MNENFSNMGGGIIQDLPPEQIRPDQWSDGNNVRFVRAQVSRIPGQMEVFGTASPSGTIGSLATGNAIYLQHIDDDDGQPWWIYCTTDRIYATDGSIHYDISHSGTGSGSISFAATQDYGWNGGNFNGVAIINSHTQAPRFWVPNSGTKTQELTNWPASTTCRVMRPYKTFLMAIAVDEGAGFNENVVRWPTAADIGGLPPSWDYNDTTQDAGRIELDDGFGKLIDGGRLRNDFFVYAEHAIYRLSPVPSRDIFSYRRKFSEVGLLTRNCITTIKHRHAFLGDGDILLHDGQSMDSIATKRWKEWVFSQIGDNWQRSFVVNNFANNEIWFCFPAGSAEYPDKALIWNYDDNTLSSRDLLDDNHPRGVSFAANGKLPLGSDDSFDNGADLTFDEEANFAFNKTSTEINVPDLVLLSYADISAIETQLIGQNNVVALNGLVDFDADFINDGVQIGDTVINTDDTTTANVVTVVDPTVLILDADIFTSASENYSITVPVTPQCAFFAVDNTLLFDTENYTAYVEKDCVPLGPRKTFNQYQEYQVQTIFPRVRSQVKGNIGVRIGMRDSVGDDIQWVDSATFAIGVDDSVDVRATGTVCTIRFQSLKEDDPFDWELNGFGIEYSVVGSRQA